MVGMSGGVDSAVAAHILKEQGYDVAGLFMKNWEEDDAAEYCTALADFGDAAAVCDKLGIDLLTSDFSTEYWDNVFEYFLADYRAGSTPNPDVLCNREIKFKLFADYATELGFDTLATGHYARRSDMGEPFRLLKACDTNKDQTYFLQAVPASRLERCLFPIGDLPKPKVREQARALGFEVHDKKDSTGICFIGERRFDDFLARYVRGVPGPIQDIDGTRLGEHRGLPFYTLGQRQGIGLGGIKGRAERAWYVAGKDPSTNTLTVTQDERDLDSSWLVATQLNWISPSMGEGVPDGQGLRCSAKVRYRQPEQPCELAFDGDHVRVVFDIPQRAVTPGQFAAFYDGDECLGGGRIVAAGSCDG
ncbi:MAG: tRNA 2-thiouridine(34) synthase MnmA [Gammaproteobacteria bacterium]|nr:tRNA 2-thiouridine(34) synthase MnmA [Gammaproteobacteria bacterium]